MKYPPVILAILFCASISVSQNNSPDSYKTSLDRLDSLTHQGETEWRFHADTPHPEDPRSRIRLGHVDGEERVRAWRAEFE